MKILFPLVDALGWTLLHFLWQGTVVAVLLWLFFLAGKAFSAGIRYAAAAWALAAMAVWPMVTFLGQDRKTAPVVAAPRALIAVREPPRHAVPCVPAVLSGPSTVQPTVPPPAVPVSPPIPVVSARPEPIQPVSLSLHTRLRPYFPWIAAGWALGVVLLSMRCFLGWRVVRSTRRKGTVLRDPEWMARFENLKTRLRISHPVSLLVSATSAVPMVIGWLKPVVLVPAATMTGLSPAQLESILAHELAHIRRQDYLVNLCQVAVETVLFYHPAVWWVSARMREERENCCDDMAASVTGGVVAYAKALTALEEIRGLSPVPAVVVSAVGGSLLARVRRILGVSSRAPGTAIPWICGGMVFAVATLAFANVKEVHGGSPVNLSKKILAEDIGNRTKGKQEQAIATALSFFAVWMRHPS